MNTSLALRIEHALGIDEGYFMILQVFYDIEIEKSKKVQNMHPELSKLRAIILEDMNLDKMDWQQQRETIIRRVFAAGNFSEKAEITRFYGSETVEQVLNG